MPKLMVKKEVTNKAVNWSYYYYNGTEPQIIPQDKYQEMSAEITEAERFPHNEGLFQQSKELVFSVGGNTFEIRSSNLNNADSPKERLDKIIYRIKEIRAVTRLVNTTGTAVGEI